MDSEHEIWKIAEYEFKVQLHSIQRGNEQWRLSAQETKLLKLLIEDSAKFVLNNDKYLQVWPSKKADSSLHKAVEKLRRIFGGELESYIATGPYRLVVKPEHVLGGFSAPATPNSLISAILDGDIAAKSTGDQTPEQLAGRSALHTPSSVNSLATDGSDTSDIIARVSLEIRRRRGLYPGNQEASQLYERARQKWDIRKPATIKDSIRLFKLAAQRDPQYALPLIGLAEGYIMAVAHGIMSPEVALPLGKIAAQQALDINHDIGEPFASLAFISVSFDKDWIRAEGWLDQALKFSPEYAFTYNALAYVSITRGHLDRAIQALDKAIRFAPFSLPMRILQGDAYRLSGETKRAVQICSDICKESPDSLLAHLCLGLACTQAGDHKQAIREHAIVVKLGKGNPQYNGFLGFALAAGGKIDEAKKILQELYRQSAIHYVPQYSLALLNIGIGEHNKALSHLEQGYLKHDHWLSFALVDPKLDTLRGEKRFQQIISSFNPPPANVTP